MIAGAEGFELELGPWSCLGNKALAADEYVPDFDAVGIAPLRALRIRRPAYLAALEATSLQPVVQYQVCHISVQNRVKIYKRPLSKGCERTLASGPLLSQQHIEGLRFLGLSGVGMLAEKLVVVLHFSSCD